MCPTKTRKIKIRLETKTHRLHEQVFQWRKYRVSMKQSKNEFCRRYFDLSKAESRIRIKILIDDIRFLKSLLH